MILVLAGTAEGRAVASALAAEGADAMASLAGVTRAPLRPEGRLRIGGFGGDAGFRSFLRDHAVRAVLDATHPFAARVSARTARICAEMALPHAILDRPAWQPGPGDRWSGVASPEALEGVIPAEARVFLAVGRQDLPRYAALRRNPVVIRAIEPVAAPGFPRAEMLTSRPPWEVAEDLALLRDRRIDWIVTKNAGGQGASAKLEAARILGLPVAMIARPPLPQGASVLSSVAAALTWARATAAGSGAQAARDPGESR
ncbi:cobalt-precorrin-6A reductase [Pseudooceanicola sp. 216_PA32_1]|uniref:Cobalt-precorrin-6A reductase n=1 Tax=Pseudooceanicola pacificus TaxID=2676438 RepID=A0A844W9J8_9RHOB|nr:cobalt-precorrin-6A reductase [Pseudooceanicola pacificus]MWB79584.1 cobalt-precorrin-6A reductase [Pseudooceanicola pacificus]